MKLCAVIDTNVIVSALLSKLVTGNQKHYPVKDFIVTPGEMLRIIEQSAK